MAWILQLLTPNMKWGGLKKEDAMGGGCKFDDVRIRVCAYALIAVTFMEMLRFGWWCVKIDIHSYNTTL